MSDIVIADSVAAAFPPAHCITYGDPGGGKSTFACTWPKPLLVKLFDAHGKDMPYVKWARANGATDTKSIDESGVPLRDFVAPNGDWIRIEYFNDLSPQSRSWELFDWHMKERAFFEHGWATVVIDSVTFMELSARMHARHVVNPNSKEPRQWFGYSTDALEYALLVQLQAFPQNLLVLAHIDANKDEVLGTYVRQLAAPGRLTSRNELAAGYAELYRAYVLPNKEDPTNMQYVLQTARDASYNCASQIGAPNPCWQDYRSLWTNWQ